MNNVIIAKSVLFKIWRIKMERLRIFVDNAKLDMRAYQLDEQAAGEACLDTLDSFRAAAFATDFGVRIGKQPKHNVPGSLLKVPGVANIIFNSPNYLVFKQPDANWDGIEPQIIEVLAQAFGEIKKTEIIDGPLSE